MNIPTNDVATLAVLALISIGLFTAAVLVMFFRIMTRLTEITCNLERAVDNLSEKLSLTSSEFHSLKMQLVSARKDQLKLIGLVKGSIEGAPQPNGSSFSSVVTSWLHRKPPMSAALLVFVVAGIMVSLKVV